MFNHTSRYADLPVLTHRDKNGRTISYSDRRIVPQPSAFEGVEMVAVELGQRLDSIAAAQLGSAEQFWLLCDANGVLRPDELDSERTGRMLRVPLPGSGPARQK